MYFVKKALITQSDKSPFYIQLLFPATIFLQHAPCTCLPEYMPVITGERQLV
ncbi:hypothetical protein FLA_3982 [Filimonas lacunae]|nr:hypothetical protein FLA_3982 [Filimonas lacunae]